jgi:hypothetical protein
VVRGVLRHRLGSYRIGKSEGFPKRGALASYRIYSPPTQKDTFLKLSVALRFDNSTSMNLRAAAALVLVGWYLTSRLLVHREA